MSLPAPVWKLIPFCMDSLHARTDICFWSLGWETTGSDVEVVDCRTARLTGERPRDRLFSQSPSIWTLILFNLMLGAYLALESQT